MSHSEKLTRLPLDFSGEVAEFKRGIKFLVRELDLPALGPLRRQRRTESENKSQNHSLTRVARYRLLSRDRE